MVVNKAVIVLIIIFIINIVDIYCIYRKYRTGITGTPFCKYPRSGVLTVFISDKPHVFKEKKPIAKIVGKLGYPFYIEGLVGMWRKPNLFLKIFYFCSKKPNGCEKMFVKQIPWQFVFSRGRLLNHYSLNNFTLTSYKSSTTVCKRSNSCWC